MMYLFYFFKQHYTYIAFLKSQIIHFRGAKRIWNDAVTHIKASKEHLELLHNSDTLNTLKYHIDSKVQLFADQLDLSRSEKQKVSHIIACEIQLAT